MNDKILNTQTSYDQVAVEYAEKFKDEMDDKPFDRDLSGSSCTRSSKTWARSVTWAVDPVRSRAICIVRAWIL